MVAAKKSMPEPEGRDERAVSAQLSRLKNWQDLIERDPNLPGEDRARVRDSGIAVWAIVGYLRALGPEISHDTITQAAHDFKVPLNEIAAAVAYYFEHRDAIDARLKINAAAVA